MTHILDPTHLSMSSD